MEKVLAIQFMYPNAVMFVDFSVINDGKNNETINMWKLENPQPTDAELQTAWLGYVREKKQLELKTACEKTILSGFTATNGHNYQFDYKDQDNFTQQMLLYVSNPTDTTTVDWNTDEGVVTHTREQFFTVCQDSTVHKRSNFAKYWGLLNSLALAQDEPSINAINWV